jgi:histidinol-phosphate aminotransferase
VTYERDNIRRMRGYTSGEQPDGDDVIKLNTNENPYPPSPAVDAALKSFDARALRRYPQPTADRFRALAAQRHGVSIDRVMVTNGGDELLRMAFTTFLDRGDVFGTTDPSYSLYSVLAEIQSCEVKALPLTDDWDLPRDFAQQMNDAGARLVCIVNPHAPTGALVDADVIGDIANELDGVLLIDEAYVDFVDPSLRHDVVNMVRAFDNVLLLRTLSKGYSLAGLRFGYGIGSPNLIEPMLTKTRDSYNIDAIAQSVACAGFADRDYAETTWSNVRGERRRLRDALRSRGFDVPPSQTNFLLATVPLESAHGAAALYAALKSRGILVRYFDAPRLDDKLRISIGDPAQNDRLLAAIDAILAPGA